MKLSRFLAVLAWCAVLAGSQLAPALASFIAPPASAQPQREAPAHDDEQGECPESSETASEDNDAKHPAAFVYTLPAPAPSPRERGLSARPHQRDEKPLLPPPIRPRP